MKELTTFEEVENAKYVTSLFDVRRCIIRVNKCYTEEVNMGHEKISMINGIGLDAVDDLKVNHDFGMSTNVIRESTSDEILELRRALLDDGGLHYFVDEIDEYFAEMTRKQEEEAAKKAKAELIKAIQESNLSSSFYDLLTVRVKMER